MQYQTKWMRNMLKSFASRQSALMRTLAAAGLLIGCLGIVFVGLQQSLLNAQARSATSPYFGQVRSVSIAVASHIDQRTVTYTLSVHTAPHTGIIRRGIPVTFTDRVPVGLSHIIAKGDHWIIRVSSKLSPALVSGTYQGSYPIDPGTTLPAVTIQGTISPRVSRVLTDSAAVIVWGNADKVHSRTIVSDTVQPTASAVSLVTSSDSSSICDNSCDTSDDSLCDSSCQQEINNACDNQCGSLNPNATNAQNASNACDNQCGPLSPNATSTTNAQDTSNACDNQCGPLNPSTANAQNASDACGNQCAQASGVRTAIQEKVHIALQESESDSESIGTACGCNNSAGAGSVSPAGAGGVNAPMDAPADGPGKGSVAPPPFPAMPNTGSDPNAKG
jgi:hypothetical protein